MKLDRRWKLLFRMVGGFEKVEGMPPELVGFSALLFLFFLKLLLLSSVLYIYKPFLAFLVFGGGFLTCFLVL
jgi:hypothetical protein